MKPVFTAPVNCNDNLTPIRKVITFLQKRIDGYLLRFPGFISVLFQQPLYSYTFSLLLRDGQ